MLQGSVGKFLEIRHLLLARIQGSNFEGDVVSCNLGKCRFLHHLNMEMIHI